jgi:hypothetical protein
MSSSILESILTALVADLNTSRPTGVPLCQRDTWVDVDIDPTVMPVLALSGFEEERLQGQADNALVDFRVLKANFEIYAKGVDGGVSPSQAADAIVQWIAQRCGVVDVGHSLVNWAEYVELEKRMAIIGKGNACRCLVVLKIQYRNVVNDITRVK